MSLESQNGDDTQDITPEPPTEVRFYEFEDEEEFIKETADEIALICRMNQEKRMRIGLSGGLTPAPLYRELARRKDIPWTKIDLFQVDERCVPPDDERSNQRMIREKLIQPLQGFNRTFFTFNTTLPPAEAVAKYKEKLEMELGDNSFDILIMGIGTDGHTASLFPHSPALESDEPVAHTQTDESEDRLTLTPKALKTEHVFLLGRRAKTDVIQQLRKGGSSVADFPAEILRLNSKKLHISQLNRE